MTFELLTHLPLFLTVVAVAVAITVVGTCVTVATTLLLSGVSLIFGLK